MKWGWCFVERNVFVFVVFVVSVYIYIKCFVNGVVCSVYLFFIAFKGHNNLCSVAIIYMKKVSHFRDDIDLISRFVYTKRISRIYFYGARATTCRVVYSIACGRSFAVCLFVFFCLNGLCVCTQVDIWSCKECVTHFKGKYGEWGAGVRFENTSKHIEWYCQV